MKVLSLIDHVRKKAEAHAMNDSSSSESVIFDAASSTTNSTPASGAEKAPEIAAPAPMATKSRLCSMSTGNQRSVLGLTRPRVMALSTLFARSPVSRCSHATMRRPMMAPMWMRGPSGPRKSPLATVSTVDAALASSVVTSKGSTILPNRLRTDGSCAPLRKASTIGMPDERTAGATKTKKEPTSAQTTPTAAHTPHTETQASSPLSSSMLATSLIFQFSITAVSARMALTRSDTPRPRSTMMILGDMSATILLRLVRCLSTSSAAMLSGRA
mmetsp:Transcript_5047/g.18171  ORF Transcript_5047/g.18171 Transcript_5047/m.18171 type:complete len:272 (-) Transcript_5047:182-997(-)